MKYEVEEINDFLVIHIIGSMTNAAHLTILDEAIDDHIAEGFHKFLFNLEKVDSIDLEGVNIFINCLTVVDVHGGGCYLLVEDDEVFATISTFGLDQLMPIYRNRDEFTEEHGISIND